MNNIQKQYRENIPTLNFVELIWRGKPHSLLKEHLDSIYFLNEGNQVTLVIDYYGREYMLATINLDDYLTDAQLNIVDDIIKTIDLKEKQINLDNVFDELFSKLRGFVVN